jgi:hypothetical protein
MNNRTNYEKAFLYITLLFSLFAFAQNEQLAGYYYDRGDFEKLKWDMKNC